jgi:hypothetical protein
MKALGIPLLRVALACSGLALAAPASAQATNQASQAAATASAPTDRMQRDAASPLYWIKVLGDKPAAKAAPKAAPKAAAPATATATANAAGTPPAAGTVAGSAGAATGGAARAARGAAPGAAALPTESPAVAAVNRAGGVSLASAGVDPAPETTASAPGAEASPRHHGSDATYSWHVLAPSTSLGIVPREALTRFPDTTLPYWLSSIVPFLETADVYVHGERSPFAPEYAYDAALPWLEASQQPAFLWVHTLPPHDPYLPPPSTKHTLLPAGTLDRWSQMLAMGNYGPPQQALIDQHRLRYQEALLGADESLGRFLEALQKRGKLDQALVIVTSDHGESFERGYLGHAGELVHDAVLHVPLVIKLPGQRAGRVVDDPVSLADVVPTITDLLKLPGLPTADGRSLAPALRGETLKPAPVYAMAMERQSRFRPIHAGNYTVIEGRYKLVLQLDVDRAALYDLDNDPHELRDISAAQPAVSARLLGLLRQQLQGAEQRRAARFDSK